MCVILKGFEWLNTQYGSEVIPGYMHNASEQAGSYQLMSNRINYLHCQTLLQEFSPISGEQTCCLVLKSLNLISSLWLRL